jgi:dTDP-4-dehydrorhamnose 3,5-epimerase
MNFLPCDIEGVFRITPDLHEDSRGFFTRTFCSEEFREHGLCVDFPQHSRSFNTRKNTLRGMHFQEKPWEEIKLIRCTRGAVLDVLVDIRPDSPTFGTWCAAELTEANGEALYAPKGIAHGFVTLRDDSELLYYISESYHPEAAKGFRWDDPDIAIDWPLETEPILSDRDRSLPLFRNVFSNPNSEGSGK